MKSGMQTSDAAAQQATQIQAAPTPIHGKFYVNFLSIKSKEMARSTALLQCRSFSNSPQGT